MSEITNGKRAISVDTAIRLAIYFGTAEQFWLNVQQRYSIHTTMQQKELLQEIGRIPAYHAK